MTNDADPADADVPEVHRSSRDPESVRPALEGWLAERLPAGAEPTISSLDGVAATGMSSDTVLFDATWTEDGQAVERRLVARIAPAEEDIPVHPRYDLAEQFEVIRRVGQRTSVPVPVVSLLESEGGPFGAPFFLMDRIDGRVPPDVLPYTFGDNWLFDATAVEQRHLQDATVGVLAELHAIEVAEDEFAFVHSGAHGTTSLARHLSYTRAWYDFAKADAGPSALIETAFERLDALQPDHESDTVLGWGDARIGNVLYDGFDPVGVLDWEMARLGPRELDLGWMIYSHRVFDDFAVEFAGGGMPDFLQRDDVAATYESLTGHTPRDLDFYCLYAATQWSIIFLRTGLRSVRFGEREAPGEADELVMNRSALERMCQGTYWR